MRSFATGVVTWLAATVVATWVAWTGVSFVGHEVTDHHPTIAAAGVKQGLRGSAPVTATGSSAGPLGASTDQSASAGGGPSTTLPAGASEGDVTKPVEGAGALPVASPRINAPVSSPSSGAPTTTTTPAPPETTRSMSAQGGFVTVGCRDAVIRIVSSSPNAGYTMDVSNQGPESVEVHFVSPGREDQIQARCVDGVPTQVADAG